MVEWQTIISHKYYKNTYFCPPFTVLTWQLAKEAKKKYIPCIYFFQTKLKSKKNGALDEKVDTKKLHKNWSQLFRWWLSFGLWKINHNYKLKIPDAEMQNLVGLGSIHRLVPRKNYLITNYTRSVTRPPPLNPLSVRYIHSLSRSQKSLYVYRYILHTTTIPSLSLS